MNATLRDLLQREVDARKARGERASFEVLSQEVLREAERTGADMTLNRTTISRILRGNYIGVTPRVIRAVAYLANVPDDLAFIAAGRTPPGQPFAEELPPGVDDLRPRERRAAVEVLKALIAQRQEIDQYEREYGPLDTPSADRLEALAYPRTSGEGNETQEAGLTDYPEVPSRAVTAARGAARRARKSAQIERERG